MFDSIVSIWRTTTTITGRNALTFTTGEMLATSCFSRKVLQLSRHLFGVNLHTFLRWKAAQLPPLLVLIYTYSYSENSPTATSLGVNSLPPSIVCWSHCKQFGPRSGLDKTSGLIWIQNVWHSDGIPERIFQHWMILKKSADDKKACKITTQKAKSYWLSLILTVHTRFWCLLYKHAWTHP